MTHWLRVEAAIGRHSILLIEKPYRSNIYNHGQVCEPISQPDWSAD